MTIVGELEVIDIQDGEREHVLVAVRGGDGQRKLVLKGTLIGQLGQPVARCTLKCAAMVAHQPPPADEIKHTTAGNQGEQPDQHEYRPHTVQLRVIDKVGVADRVDVATTGQIDRKRKVEVACALCSFGLQAGVGAAVQQRRDDLRIAIARARHTVATRSANNMVLVNQDRLERAGTARDRIEQLVNLADSNRWRARERAIVFKARDVRSQIRSIGADLPALQTPVDQHVRGDPDDRRRDHHRRDEPQPKGEPRTALASTAPAKPTKRPKPASTPHR